MWTASNIDLLIGIVARLRTPGTGCPWDLQQTHRSLAPYALEEAYEVVDAIERGGPDDLRDELGDLLLQVVLHARLAEEAGAFSLADVVAAVADKMVRRHPHVFGGSDGPSTPRSEAWERIKADERRAKGVTGLLSDVAPALPGLTRAVKLQRKAATVGFDWNDVRLVLAKVREEINELERELDGASPPAIEDELGDILFAVANLARHVGADPETAIRGANAKFERRFAHIEAVLAARGVSPDDASLAEMEALWQEAKAAGL